MSNFLRPLVLSGPSGVGKSTLLQRLFAEFPDKFGFSVSHTTRSPRPGEIHGKQYFFNSQANFYGTSFETVRLVHEQGRRCILGHRGSASALDPIYLFISPPTLSALRSRLQAANRDRASTQKRLATALKEIAYARNRIAYELFKKVALGEEI
ncbi:P-loop containing nucleoside triphosphate hydrolase protein, partial [Mycena leptocephala]